MHDTYTKLMLHQDLSQDMDAAFYEKLETTQPKKRIPPLLRVAMIAVCVALLIPATVWAAESIFGVTKVTQTERPTYHDNKPGTGLDIVYENIEDYRIEDFSKHLQELKEYEEAVHENWAAAEEYLGIDLIDNPLFTANDTYRRATFGEQGKNAATTCWTYDDKLFASRVSAAFERNQTSFWVRAMVSVDLPAEIKDDVYNYYHGYSITYSDRNSEKVDVNTEQYLTPTGIPVLIVTVTSEGNLKDCNTTNDWEYLVDCIAFFAVNNVTYSVHADRNSSYTEENVMPALLEFLDGFVIE